MKLRHLYKLGIFSVLMFIPSFAAAGNGTILGTVNLSQLTNPSAFFSSGGGGATALIGSVINLALIIGGAAAVAMIVWGGFKMISSVGDPEKVKSARGILLAAVVGLALILMSAAIANFFASGLSGQLGL